MNSRVYVTDPNSEGEWRILYAAYHSEVKRENGWMGFLVAFVAMLLLLAPMLGGGGL